MEYKRIETISKLKARSYLYINVLSWLHFFSLLKSTTKSHFEDLVPPWWHHSLFIVLFVNSLLLLTEQVFMNLESSFLLYVLNFSDCQDGWCVMNPSWHSSSEDMYLFCNAALILVFFILLNSIFSRAVTLRLAFWNIFLKILCNMFVYRFVSPFYITSTI